MTHSMKLREDMFEMIKNKTKNIEMRLNDEKRQLIKIGDNILFTNISTNEQLLIKVTNLYHFKDFNDLYKSFTKERIGYKAGEKADPNDMSVFYKKEDIKKYGTLAIEVMLVE